MTVDVLPGFPEVSLPLSSYCFSCPRSRHLVAVPPGPWLPSAGLPSWPLAEPLNEKERSRKRGVYTSQQKKKSTVKMATSENASIFVFSFHTFYSNHSCIILSDYISYIMSTTDATVVASRCNSQKTVHNGHDKVTISNPFVLCIRKTNGQKCLKYVRNRTEHQFTVRNLQCCNPEQTLC